MVIVRQKKKRFTYEKSVTPTVLVWDTNMAAVLLFWDTNMADVTSCERPIVIGHFEVARETGSVLCRVAPRDCFGGRILPQFPAHSLNSQ